MARKYYTLLTADEDGRWGIHFGDYSRETVQDELTDMVDHDVKRKHLKIIATSDDQASIDGAVSQLNERK